MIARTLPGIVLTAMLMVTALTAGAQDKPGVVREKQGYAGSKSCMECHERFYRLWSTCRHGLAMQPHSAGFAKARLAPQAGDVVIGKSKCRADLTGGVVSETGIQMLGCSSRNYRERRKGLRMA